MTLGSSSDTVAIIYDIENSPFEMLDYTLGKARKHLPCRMIVASDWEKRPNQKRWNRLLRRDGYTFRQIDRTTEGKNSLDYALFDTAMIMKQEGVKRFYIITTDSDFVKIAQALKQNDNDAYIVGVGTQQASKVLRDAYDEFICFPQEQKEKKSKLAASKSKLPAAEKAKTAPAAANTVNELTVKLPRTLYQEILARQKTENVSLNELVTYLLMRGMR